MRCAATTAAADVDDAGKVFGGLSDGDMSTGEFAIFLNGGYGAGKSTVLEHLGDALASRHLPFCLMDVDWFHRCWPPAAEDPRNVLTEAKNIADVWRNYRATGPHQLIVAGVLESPGDVKRYRDALRLPIRSIRLEASAVTARARLVGRYSLDQRRALEWHLERFEATARRITDADLDDLVAGTDHRTPGEIAECILSAFGLREADGHEAAGGGAT